MHDTLSEVRAHLHAAAVGLRREALRNGNTLSLEYAALLVDDALAALNESPRVDARPPMPQDWATA